MAITPNSYSFSGGAFMGGGGSPVNRDDIHTLSLTKNGESIGNYNPLVGDADVDVPSDAVVISFSTFSGAMPGPAYSKMASAVGAGQVVMLRSVSGASVVYWTLLAASVLSYKFISVSETAVLTVEIQTSGDSSGNHAFTISNVPLTELRVIDTGASSGDDRGHEHTRIAEALAAGKTVCIKYTSGNNIAYGTLCGAHDGHYTFIVDYGGTPSVLTVIADGSMQISAIFDGDASEFSVTPDGSSTGYNIAGPTLLKSFLQKFKNLVSALKSLAFKDKASYNDLSSGVQSSLDKADSALQSHQSVTDNNPTLDWNTTSKVGSVGSTDLRVTMPANPAQNLPASVITSGTFGTNRIADDAITAAKVKDNETLPVNVSGTAEHLSAFGRYDTWDNSYDSSKPYVILAEVRLLLSSNTGAGQLFQLEFGNGHIVIFRLNFVVKSGTVNISEVAILYSTLFESALTNKLAVTYFKYDSDTKMTIRIYFKFSGNWQVATLRQLDAQTGDEGRTNWEKALFYDGSGSDIASTVGTIATFIYSSLIGNSIYASKIGSYESHPSIGSTTTPVYVDPDGQVQPCTQGATLKSNTATLYIAGYTDNNIPYYHVKDIKNGCVNHVAFSGITNSTCDITFEAPTLATGEEYDYIISLEGYADNSGYTTGAYVENCKQVLHYDSVNNLWTAEPLFLQATDWRQICVVGGNTCEWKRIALS